MIIKKFKYLSFGFHPANKLLFLGVVAILFSDKMLGQTSNSETPSELDIKQSLDDSHWISPRALGMGGALSTLADGYDAPYYNPAGIGGLQWGASKKKGTMRNVYFPLSGLSLNENSYKLHNDFSKKGGASDSSVGRSLIDAAEGKRQYARVSNMLGLGINRTIIIPYMDQQGSAVSQGDGALIDARFNFTTGYGSGFSVSNPKGTFLLGAFGFVESRTTYKGTFDYMNLISTEERSKEIKDKKYTYSGQGMHVGTLFRIPQKLQPSLAVNLRHMGNTKYKLKKAPAEDVNAKTEVKKQDLTVGMSISPEIKKIGYWNLIFEGHNLLEKDTDMARKLRIANELSFGGFGNESWMALRAGFSEAGPSGGISLNLGLINFEAAISSIRYGADNRAKAERRGSATIFIDVSE